MHKLSAILLTLCFVFLVQVVQAGEKVVLITGCSSGIGLASAEHLADNGYIVYATVRNVKDLRISPNKKLHFRILDVTELSTIQRVVSEMIAKEGRIDVLINNAGYALGGPLECLTMDEILEQMNTNFFGAIRTCQEVLPYMRKQKRGHIINISSEQGVYGWPYGSMYTASKAAIESMSEALSIEVMPWNIGVSIIEPGFVATDFFVKLGSRKVEGDPYKKINEIDVASLNEKREPSELVQSSGEIAQFLQNVIEDPEPRLRYQTSKSVEETVSKYIVDPTGQEYTKRIKEEIKAIYKDAW